MSLHVVLRLWTHFPFLMIGTHAKPGEHSEDLPGYFNPGYVRSLGEFGHPIVLQGSGASILQRAIGGSGLSDAMGAYPLFCCPDWSELHSDLQALREKLVSIVLAPDPLSSPANDWLSGIFEYVHKYKEHYLVRTGPSPESFVNPRHRKHAIRALKEVQVERDTCEDPLSLAEEFNQLFATLAERHQIQGLRRFSRYAFAQQFALPGLVVFRATALGITIGLDTWYVQNECAQGHLSALHSKAYNLHAAYAIKWRVLEYFRDKVQCINLGGGHSLDGSDGLSAFKRGWSNDSVPSWLCGCILQPQNYTELVNRRQTSQGNYFPEYRSGELG